jgi:hypothetical protein
MYVMMRLNVQLLLLLLMMAMTTHAQTVQSPSLNIGDPAPPLRVREWLKGAPVRQFQKGHVYVVVISSSVISGRMQTNYTFRRTFTG